MKKPQLCLNINKRNQRLPELVEELAKEELKKNEAKAQTLKKQELEKAKLQELPRIKFLSVINNPLSRDLLALLVKL